MKILVVTARLPHPPLKGDQVRGYHHLRLLSKHHRLTLASLIDTPPPQSDLEALSQYVDEIVTVPVRKVQRSVNVLQGVWSSLPLQTLLYQTPQMARVIDQKIAIGQYDLAYIQLARMAPYLLGNNAIPRVIDLIDALSLNMQRRFLRERGPMRWISKIEWQRMSHYERIICKKYEQATVVSEIDKITIGEYDNLNINPNGVDLQKFSYISPSMRTPTMDIVFSGNMGYFPNINAVTWFVECVLPHIKKQIQNVRFIIVGVNPSDAVKKLAEGNASVHVTGFVDSVQEYLSRAALAVVPLQAGSGMQFKVIEAMATGTPLVVTPFALGGIDVTGGRHLLVAEDAVTFAQKVVLLLRDLPLREKLASNGRHLVEINYSWERCVDDLEVILERAFYTKQKADHKNVQ